MSPSDVDQELERLLAHTRAATEPTADARARVRASLGTRLASATPVGASATVLKSAGVLVVLGALVGLAVWSRPPPAALSPSTAPSGHASSLPLEPVPVGAPPANGRRSDEERPLDVAPSSAGVRPNVGSSAKPHPLPAADPAAELALISALQVALRSSDSARTLLLAEQHAQRFPRGAMVEERESARAIARCRLAAPEERAGLNEAFVARYGGSPYAARVKDACGR